MAQQFTVPHSRQKITFTLPEGMEGQLVHSNGMPALTGADLDAALLRVAKILKP